MQVYMKNNKGAVMYRGVPFVDENPTEVLDVWFDRCPSPDVVEYTAPKPKKKKAE